MSFSAETITQLYRALAYHQKRAAMLSELLAEGEPPKAQKRPRASRKFQAKIRERAVAAESGVVPIARVMRRP